MKKKDSKETLQTNAKKTAKKEAPKRRTKKLVSEEAVLTPVSSAETIEPVKVETTAPETEVKEATAVLAETPEIKEEIKEPSEKAVEAVEAAEKEVDPIFAELAAPKLPDLERENRARLQMQSPNRLYFYWRMKNNPFQTLQKVSSGSSGSYQLVAKLVNRTNEREEMVPVETEGSWWFNVEANADYQAEVGFYAPNRPYIRVMFSNTIETPRKTPSPRAATDADWAISSHQFAEVLDYSGFQRDAFEVALTGDDAENAETATNKAFDQFLGKQHAGGFNSEELRFALLALASGVSLEKLRGQISEALYILLQENPAGLGVENALAALKEHFDVFDEEIIEEEEIGPAVFGASLVNFPKSVKKRAVPKTGLPQDVPRFGSELSPLSSFSLGN